MTDFLVKHFVKNYDQVDEIQVRTQYGTLASMVGIGCNMLLFAAKLFIGVLVNSISVMADAFNLSLIHISLPRRGSRVRIPSRAFFVYWNFLIIKKFQFFICLVFLLNSCSFDCPRYLIKIIYYGSFSFTKSMVYINVKDA